MKNKIFQALLLVGIIACAGLSCKKENEGIKVEYQVAPGDQYIESVAWQLQDTVHNSDGSDWKDGKKTVYFKQKPFSAAFEVEFNNTTNAQKVYDLFIWVEGELKANKTVTVQPFAVSVGLLEFDVQ